MNLPSSRGSPDSLKQCFKGSERKLSLGAPDMFDEVCHKFLKILECFDLKTVIVELDFRTYQSPISHYKI